MARSSSPLVAALLCVVPLEAASIPTDYASWLSAKVADVTLSGGQVTAVTDKNSASAITTIGSPAWTAADGFYLDPSNHFQMDTVNTPGTWTVFMSFKTTTETCPIAGADPGGHGHFDTEVGFGPAGNVFISGVNPGEFFMSTHYSGGVNNGVHTAGKTFNDGEWHWVEIYGGASPHKYSLLFDTGDYYENTAVNTGWMRSGVAFYVGRGQGTGYYGYVKDVIVYNRYVPPAEAAAIHAHMDIVIGKVVPTTAPTSAPTESPTSSPTAATTGASYNGPTSAKGDPHLTNINGQRFDLVRAGRHVLIHIPRNADAPSILLRVVADVLRLGAQCGETYFQHINITGAWVKDNHNGILQFHADDVGGEEEATWMSFGAVSLKVVHAQHRGGIRYLNIYAKHLGRVQFKIGGLLGEDDHEYEATPDQDCVPRINFYATSPQDHPPSSPPASSAEASLA